MLCSRMVVRKSNIVKCCQCSVRGCLCLKLKPTILVREAVEMKVTVSHFRILSKRAVLIFDDGAVKNISFNVQNSR